MPCFTAWYNYKSQTNFITTVKKISLLESSKKLHVMKQNIVSPSKKLAAFDKYSILCATHLALICNHESISMTDQDDKMTDLFL